MSIIKNLTRYLSKHSAELLVGAGISAMCSSTILAVKNTPKAIKKIEELKEENGEDLKKIDILKKCLPYYVSSVLLTGAAAGCFIQSLNEKNKSITLLASVCGASESTIKEYQNFIIDKFGEETHEEILTEIAKEDVKKNPPISQNIILTERGSTLCKDAISGRYFKSDPSFIQSAINELNIKLRSEMFISLNEFYYEIGLEETDLGDILGWSIDDGPIQLTKRAILTDYDEPCFYLSFDQNQPKTNY